MINLRTLPATYLTALGPAKVAELCGKTPSVVGMWAKTGRFPLESLAKLMEAHPEIAGEPVTVTAAPPTPEPAVEQSQDPAIKLAILMCSNRTPETATMESIMRLMRSGETTFRSFNYSSITHVRNMAAGWFLRSGLPWSYWTDDDMLNQCGDAQFFNDVLFQSSGIRYPESYAKLNAIHRLMVHGKKFTSGAYFGKRRGIGAQFGGAELHPTAIARLIANGPADKIIPVDYTGMGGALIHRDVFLDIIKTQGDSIKVKIEQVRTRLAYDYGFFNRTMEDNGEDYSFCQRAIQAGHIPFVDLAVMPAHCGQRWFTYADQAKA
jgi:hypothetical protein